MKFNLEEFWWQYTATVMTELMQLFSTQILCV